MPLFCLAVYPSLDLSDDEDFPVFKPRGKKKEDEAWNPKARVRVSGPRPERPMRQGVRRQAVEKGLEQAAARRQNLPVREDCESLFIVFLLLKIKVIMHDSHMNYMIRFVYWTCYTEHYC